MVLLGELARSAVLHETPPDLDQDGTGQCRAHAIEEQLALGQRVAQEGDQVVGAAQELHQPLLQRPERRGVGRDLALVAQPP